MSHTIVAGSAATSLYNWNLLFRRRQGAIIPLQSEIESWISRKIVPWRAGEDTRLKKVTDHRRLGAT